MERRLAAILAADVVGYSRLMEQDEAGTMAALADRRKTILEPVLTKYHGVKASRTPTARVCGSTRAAGVREPLTATDIEPIIR